MNNLGLAVSWCIAQVTLLATIAALVYLVAGKFAPRIRGTIALTSLVCIVPLSAMVFSPWPRWNLPDLPQVEIVEPAAPIVADEPTSNSPLPDVAANEPQPTITASHDNSRFIELGNVLNNETSIVGPAEILPTVDVDALVDEQADQEAIAPINSRWITTAPAPYDLEPPVAAEPVTGRLGFLRSEHWALAIIAFFIASLAVGMARLMVGLAFVRSQRRWSATIENPELLDLVDLLCADAGGTRWVDVRESARISTAATIGWRRPMILLPIDWQQWTPTELRAVLAHEIAHIRNRDFIAWLWAQLGLSLHFYHPLVHWLVGRLRLEQELAADALAAPLAGGSTLYLNTLAAMALRQSERPLSWPARAFLPTRDTLLRRIEMLKHPQQFSKSLFSRPVRYAAVLVVLCGGIVAAGFRAAQDAIYQPPVTEMSQILHRFSGHAHSAMWHAEQETRRLHHDAVGTEHLLLGLTNDGSIDELEFLSRRQIDSRKIRLEVEAIVQRGTSTQVLNLPLTAAAKQAILFAKGFSARDAGADQDLDYVKPQHLLLGLLQEENGIAAQVLMKLGFRLDDLPTVASMVIHDDLREPSQPTVSDLIAETAPAPKLNAEATEEKEESKPAVENLVTPKSSLQFQINGRNHVLIGDEIRVFDDKVEVRGKGSVTETRSDAKTSHLQLGDKVIVSDNAIAVGDGLKVVVPGGIEHFTPKTDADNEYVAKTTENFNRIAAALRKFRAVRGYYPSSAMTDGAKIPYSWRVAILPFFEGNEGLELYEQYNFSEPWDGPTNTKLLDKMPAAYRSPLGATVTTNNQPGPDGIETTMATSYYMLGGPVFGSITTMADTPATNSGNWPVPFVQTEKHPSSKITSAAQLIVEANRTTPWTKPSDILFDPEGPIEQLNGNHAEALPVLDSKMKTSFLARSAGRDKTLAALSQLRNGPVPTLYFFHAAWAAPSQQVRKVIEELIPKQQGSIEVEMVDSDTNSEKVRQFNVAALPTIVIRRGSTELARQTGMISEDGLLNLIKQATAIPDRKTGEAVSSPTVRATAPTAVVAREKTELERAVAGMTLIYFQDKARKVVPGLMLDAGDETLFITTSPATFHPEGVPPAIDRLELLPGPFRADTVKFEFSQDSTNELYVARAKQRVSDFKLDFDKVASISVGDELDAAYFDESGNLNILRAAAKFVKPQGSLLKLGLDPETLREYRDVEQINRKLPEGAVLLKRGKFAGLVLAGMRFGRKEVDHSFVVPPERVAELYQRIRKNDPNAATTSAAETPKPAPTAAEAVPAGQSNKMTTLRGRILLKGEPPKLPPIDLKKFDDLRGVTINGDLPDERLILGRDNGIKNVFVYLRKAPEGIKPASKRETNWNLAKLKVENGRFEPHAMLVDTKQAIEFSNPNKFSADVHLMPLKNNPLNAVLSPTMSRLHNLSLPEVIPFRITSDFHPWMSAYILPIDHPYAALTDADGAFEIRDLPPGRHQLHFWHEAFTTPIQMTTLLDGKKETLETIIPFDVKSLNLGEGRPDVVGGRSDVIEGVGVESGAGVSGTISLTEQQPVPASTTADEPQGASEEVAQQDPARNRSSVGGATDRKSQLVGEAALKTQSLNNVKHIMLAMHNYYDVHKHFPPAVLLGPDGKTPHSWRIELLPFLEQAKLHEQYKMNEPWDSPNNKKVLAQMPAVFRAPTDKNDSTNTSYFVPTGPQTMFHLKTPLSLADLQKAQNESDVAKRGLSFRDVTDGTSATIALIETKRDVPWTRPQDIDCDPTIPLPRFGRIYDDGFNVGIVDGTARAIRKDADEKSLRAVLSRAGKEVIDLDAISVPVQRRAVTGVERRAMPQPRLAAPVRVMAGAAGGGRTENAQSRNNLKLLMLAMHNYHDVHNNFPPAVVLGPDGKTPHSWRVEILPYLTRQGRGGRTYHDLFQKYKMDEPWDSPDNKKLLAEMPDVFRAPNDKPDSTNTSYFAVASQYWKTLVPGEPKETTAEEPAANASSLKTVFNGVKGTKVSEITDGTSDTIALVETRLIRQVLISVPWTEPDDVVFDSTKALPVLASIPKEGEPAIPVVFVGMADGSVHQLHIKDPNLKAMLTRSGGEIIASEPAPAAVMRARPVVPVQPAPPSLFQRIFGGGGTARPAPKNDSRTNLKRIMLAMHNYHETYNHFPAATVIGPDGKTPHSWRVALLPFLDEAPLFNEYKMDEPWDGPNNKKLLERMPAVFRTPGEAADSTNTLYFAITGEGMVFDDPKGTKISAIPDGSSNTIAVVESQKRDGEKGISVPWLKPDDIVIDAKKPLQKFGVKDGATMFWGALVDGSVREFPTKTTESDLRAMFTRAGNEAVDISR